MMMMMMMMMLILVYSEYYYIPIYICIAHILLLFLKHNIFVHLDSWVCTPCLPLKFFSDSEDVFDMMDIIRAASLFAACS